MADQDPAERVRAIMASVFHVPANQLPAEPSQDNVKRWDSLGHLRLILALESALRVKLRTDRIPGLTSLGAILDELAAHGR
jgi:acyl carrier protein